MAQPLKKIWQKLFSQVSLKVIKIKIILNYLYSISAYVLSALQIFGCLSLYQSIFFTWSGNVASCFSLSVLKYNIPKLSNKLIRTILENLLTTEIKNFPLFGGYVLDLLVHDLLFVDNEQCSEESLVNKNTLFSLFHVFFSIRLPTNIFYSYYATLFFLFWSSIIKLVGYTVHELINLTFMSKYSIRPQNEVCCCGYIATHNFEYKSKVKFVICVIPREV